jgi:hypothetical protein
MSASPAGLIFVASYAEREGDASHLGDTKGEPVIVEEPSHIDSVAPLCTLIYYEKDDPEEWPSEEDEDKFHIKFYRVTDEARKAHIWIAQLPDLIVVKSTACSDDDDDVEPGKARAFREIKARFCLMKLGEMALPYYPPLLGVLVTDKPFTGPSTIFRSLMYYMADFGPEYFVPTSELQSPTPSAPVQWLLADDMGGIQRRLRGVVLGNVDGGKGSWHDKVAEAKARGPVNVASSEWQAVVAQWRSAITGLGILHSAGIVHHDMKASNIVRVSDTQAVLIDFEHALFVDSEEDEWAFETPTTEEAAIRVMRGFYANTWAFGTPERVTYGQFRFSRDLYAMALSMFELVVPGAVVAAVKTQDDYDDPESPDHALDIAIDEALARRVHTNDHWNWM